MVVETENQENLLFKGHEEIQGVNIGYCRYGSGPTNILTICGAVGSYEKDWPLESLKHFDPTLYTVVSIDPPGYGTSRPPDRKQEINRCAKDAPFCIELMEKLSLLPFTVAGWSEGSRTAIHVAFRGKEKVNRMVLLAATTKVDNRWAAGYSAIRNTDDWMDSDRKVYLKHVDNAFLKKQWSDMCDVIQECYNMLGGRFPCDDVIRRVTCPSLLLCGRQDQLCQADPKQILALMKDGRMETQLNGFHDFHVKYPKWVADKIDQFIRTTEKKE